MEIIITFLLCTVFTIPIHTIAATVRPNLEKKTSESLLNDVDPNTSYSTSTEEYVTNSIDDHCNIHTEESSVQPANNEPSIKHQRVDTDAQFRTRIQEIDILETNPQSDLISEPAPGSTTTLRQVIFLHRHGDRTTVSFPPKDNLASEPFWSFHGLGHLTNRGKSRLFFLGSIVRDRYKQFLNGSVNKNHRISRSSGTLRCIESAQTFLSSFLNLNQTGSMDAELLRWDKSNLLAHIWQPVNIQSVPADFDGMLAESSSCAQSDIELKEINKTEEVKKIFDEHKHDARVLKDALGFVFDDFSKWFWASGQIEIERSYFPDKIKPQILAIYDSVQEAGNQAFVAYTSTIKSRRLRGGLLINDMIQNMEQFQNLHMEVPANSFQLNKFVHYAAHDITVFLLLGMFDNNDRYPFRPGYASSITIELHEEADEWFVRIFYMPSVPAKLEELHMSRCEEDHPKKRCTLSKFSNLMRPYKIENWQQWMSECDNDLHNVDPYAPL